MTIADPVSEGVQAARAQYKNVLPDGVLPRGLSRVQSAGYIGVSPTTFDRMVKERLMPQPLHIYGRRVWDRHKIDAAFVALDKADEDDNPYATRMAL